MSVKERPKFVVIGGGPAGAMLANYLGQAGHEVEVYEMRADLRTVAAKGGRSINLALSHRGVSALEPVGLAAAALSEAVSMPGRMIHARDGSTSFQAYGKDAGQAIHSVSRAGLNRLLLDGAARFPTVRLFFDVKCSDVDLEHGTVELVHTLTHERSVANGDIILGCDGAFSVVRRMMQKRDRFDFDQRYLGHGYKELTIPAGPDGGFQLDPHALHIWPRRSFMMIALPNADASFTCTLFWPFEGPNSFASIRSRADVECFFRDQYPDAVPLMPDLAADYFANPVGSMVTIRCGPWYVEEKTLLLGDASHAVVPFYGQGMNAAFEDVLVLNECLERSQPDWRRAFANFYESRKPNTDQLAALALENFLEMRDHTGSRLFRAKKKVENTLHRLLPSWYIPLYTLVSFTRMPYAQAVAHARRQDGVVRVAALVCILFLLLVVVFAFAGCTAQTCNWCKQT